MGIYIGVAMEYQYTNDKPIYLQLMEMFIIDIVSGELQKGERLESVRDLAIKAKVNPNTMQKALSELERIGLVRTERTSGRYITEDEDLINAKKNELVKAEIDKFLIKMKSMGFDKSEIIKIMEGGQE